MAIPSFFFSVGCSGQLIALNLTMGQPAFTMTSQEIGRGYMAMFEMFMYLTQGTGNIAMVTPTGYGEVAMAFTSSYVNNSAALSDQQLVESLKTAFATSIPVSPSTKRKEGKEERGKEGRKESQR